MDESIIIPILTMVIGLIANFTDSSRPKFVSAFLVIAIVLSCGFAILFNLNKDGEIENKDREIDKKDQEFESYKADPLLQLGAATEIFRSYGWPEDVINQIFPAAPDRIRSSFIT